MVFVIIFLILVFFFWRMDATSLFYFFKSRFKDEIEQQLCKNCETLNETFVIKDSHINYIGVVETYSVSSDEYDGLDIDLLYSNRLFFTLFGGYYDVLSEFENLEEASKLYTLLLLGASKTLNLDEMNLEEQTEEGTSFSKYESSEDAYRRAVVEQFFSDHWRATTSKAELISSEEVFECYEDVKNEIFEDYLGQYITENNYDWKVGGVDSFGYKGLLSVRDVYEDEKVLEKSKVQKELQILPNIYDRYFGFIFKVLYLNKNPVLKLLLNRLLISRKFKNLLLMSLGVFSKLLTCCKGIVDFSMVERETILSVSHEFGGYSYMNMFGSIKNFFLLFFFLWSGFVTINYLIDLKSVCKEMEKIVEVDELKLEWLCSYDFEPLFRVLNLDLHWIYLLLLLSDVWLLFDLFEFYLLLLDFFDMLKYSGREIFVGKLVFYNLEMVFSELRDIISAVEDLLLFYLFCVISEFVMCDEFWFFFFGSDFSLPDFCLFFFDFFVKMTSIKLESSL